MIERIVVINDSSVAKGGATGLSLASALAFRKRGLAVTLLTGDAGQNSELDEAGVEVVALGQDRLLSSPMHKVLFSALYNGSAKDMVAGWIARNDTPGTVYHLHGWAQILSPAVFQALKPVSSRLVLSAHDFFLVCPNGAYAFLNNGAVCQLTPMSAACVRANCDRRSYAHKLWRVARQSVRQSLFDFRREAPPVLAIHEAMRPFLVRGGIPEAAVRTVPNPVRPFLTERAQAERNREFLFIGRLEDGKGPDLAAAAAALESDDADALLLEEVAEHAPRLAGERRAEHGVAAEGEQHARLPDTLPARVDVHVAVDGVLLDRDLEHGGGREDDDLAHPPRVGQGPGADEGLSRSRRGC